MEASASGETLAERRLRLHRGVALLPSVPPHRRPDSTLRGVGGRHATQVHLHSPRLSACRQGRPPQSPPLPNNHQRATDQSSSRAMELEHKVAVLEVECASLHQELQEMEAHNRRAQKKPSEEANQVLQMQVWQEEVERAHQSQRRVETKISSLKAKLQKMRVEMAGMRRDAEHYSRQEHIELEKRYRELTDLLYHKQTQLKSMASEKAALEFQLEKSLKQISQSAGRSRKE